MDGIPSTSGTFLKDMSIERGKLQKQVLTRLQIEKIMVKDKIKQKLTEIFKKDDRAEDLISEFCSHTLHTFKLESGEKRKIRRLADDNLHDAYSKFFDIFASRCKKEDRNVGSILKVLDALEWESVKDEILSTDWTAVDKVVITEPITLPSSTISYGYQGVVAGYIQRQELQTQALEHLATKPNRDTRITFPVVVLHGFGGNGKSQMARRLVQILTKEVKDSDNVTKCVSVWINAVSEASVIEGFRNFANVAKEANVSVVLKNVYGLKDRNLVLVFDDGDNFEMLKKFFPLDDTETNIRVIITAHSEWVCTDKNVKNIPVSNFTVKEFKNFISEAVSCDTSEKDAKQLEGHTGRIPAILSLVCKGFSQRFKRDPKYTIAKHFAKYGNEIFTFGEDGKLVPGFKQSDYTKSARIVVEQQLACMQNYDDPELIGLAKFILNCIAYCDPNEISEEYFFKVHPQILSKANGDYGEIRQAIGILKEFGWVELVENFYYFTTYSMHACYQIGLQSQLDEEASESILHGMIEYMQIKNASLFYDEKYQHQLSFWSCVSNHSKRSLLLNHATKTNHCLIGLAKMGLTDGFKSLASAYQDQGQLVHALLQDEDLFKSSPVFYLFRNSTNHELVKYFITEIKGYYDHLQDSYEKAWIRNKLLSAITGAISSNAYEIFKFALDSFNLNVNEGPYPLIYSAASSSNLKFVQLLIEKGADVNGKYVLGQTPLHSAVEREVGAETVKLLVDNGANIHDKDDSGETALHVAVYWSNLEVVKLLVEKGADVNEKDDDGETPLHTAVQNVLEKKEYNLEIVKLLVENGANIYEINGDGDTPLQLAVKLKEKYIVDYFNSISQSLYHG